MSDEDIFQTPSLDEEKAAPTRSNREGGKKKGSNKTKSSAKKRGGNGEETMVAERDSFVVIRNDRGPAHMFRCYATTSSAPERFAVLKDLTSAQYVVQDSTLLLASHHDGKSISTPVEISASLDGPLYRPISNDSYEGETALITVPTGPPVVGIVLKIHPNPFAVEYFSLENQTTVRTLCTEIKLINSKNPVWNRDLQDLTVPLPSSRLNRIYLHYQIRSGFLGWSPTYRAILHPSFQSISLRCQANVSNLTTEILQVKHLRLRLVREGRSEFQAESSLEFASAALPSRALRMQSMPSTVSSSGTDQILQEFTTTLPKDTLPARTSCTVPLFDVQEVPVNSWYVCDIIAQFATEDSTQVSAVAPQWILKIENTRNDSDMEETSVLKQKPKQNRNTVNWPGGELQLILPASLNSNVIQPDQVNWLSKSFIPAVPVGQSTNITLPSPWNVSIKTVVTIQRVALDTIAGRPTVDRVTSTIQTEISNNDNKNETRFPLRLRILLPSGDVSISNIQPGKFRWTGMDLARHKQLSIHPDFRSHTEASYLILTIPKLSSQFKQVLTGTVSWHEVTSNGIATDVKYWPTATVTVPTALRANTNGGQRIRLRHGGIGVGVEEASQLSTSSQGSMSMSNFQPPTPSFVRSGHATGGYGSHGQPQTVDELPTVHEMDLNSLTPNDIVLPVPLPDSNAATGENDD